jgi:hemerythrin
MTMTWDESLSIGVTEIDDQHKRIFDNFNAFAAACKEGHGDEKLNDLFWFLSSYVATHFASEERLMQRIGFPGYGDHHQLHTAFVTEIDALMGRFAQEGPTAELVATASNLVKKWLTDHICAMDRTIGQFVREQGK